MAATITTSSSATVDTSPMARVPMLSTPRVAIWPPFMTGTPAPVQRMRWSSRKERAPPAMHTVRTSWVISQSRSRSTAVRGRAIRKGTRCARHTSRASQARAHANTSLPTTCAIGMGNGAVAYMPAAPARAAAPRWRRRCRGVTWLSVVRAKTSQHSHQKTTAATVNWVQIAVYLVRVVKDNGRPYRWPDVRAVTISGKQQARSSSPIACRTTWRAGASVSTESLGLGRRMRSESAMRITLIVSLRW